MGKFDAVESMSAKGGARVAVIPPDAARIQLEETQLTRRALRQIDVCQDRAAPITVLIELLCIVGTVIRQPADIYAPQPTMWRTFLRLFRGDVEQPGGRSRDLLFERCKSPLILLAR